MRKVLIYAVRIILLTALFGPVIAAVSDNLVETNLFSFFQSTTEMRFAFRQEIVFLATCVFMAMVKVVPRIRQEKV